MPSIKFITAATWNTNYPPGTPVRYYPVAGKPEYIETETASLAFTLPGNYPVVKLAHRPGSFSLTAIIPYNHKCTCDLKDSPTAPASWHAQTCPEYPKSEGA
jgi:hypothetical protein